MKNNEPNNPPSPDQLLEALIPQADTTFRKELAKRLLTELQLKQPMVSVSLTRRPKPLATSRWRAWGVVAMVMAIVGSIGIFVNYQTKTMQPTATEIPLETSAIVPDEYMEVGLALESDTLQGLQVGDRVDVLAIIDGQIRMMVANVWVSEIQSQYVMLASPNWQQGVLSWLTQEKQPYALRLHTGVTPPIGEIQRIDYVFISPESVPENFVFDIVIDVPVQQAYRLNELPSSIDSIPFTFNGNTLRFWFKDIELVSVTHGTAVTIRLPKGDAANLDRLMDWSMNWSMIPDEESDL